MKDSFSLVERYRHIWSQSWRRRKEMHGPARLINELQFLPSALELQETPVHPAPRLFSWSIMIFAALALTWACIGKIEVVAVASGKIVPSGKTKLIQSSETAVVKAIHVNDGQTVTVGELLVELDPTAANADVSRIQGELLAAHIDSAPQCCRKGRFLMPIPPRYSVSGAGLRDNTMNTAAAWH